MNIDVFTATGTKKGHKTLPAELFGGPVNTGLIHQAVVLQQSNRRHPIAHAKNRAEVVGSTKKMFQQKHTGRARRGPSRSPVLRGGGKAFGPKKDRNFEKDMPRSMRRAALRATLAMQAKQKAICGLEDYPQTIKTKTFVDLLKKLPYDLGRRILFVLPEKHEGLTRSGRNVPGVSTVLVNYLNPEAVVNNRLLVFVGDSLEKAVELFGKKTDRLQKAKMIGEAAAKAPTEPKTPAKKKAPAAKKAAAPKKAASKKKSA